MTNTSINELPIENLETFPTNNTNEKIEFIINDFKDFYTEDEYQNEKNFTDFLKIQSLNKEFKEKREFGKKLFHTLKFDNTYYAKTQKWVGHVTEITKEGFKAELKDLTNGGTDEYGEFSRDEVTEEDFDLISKGATFYMSLGIISRNGTRKKESEIRFQRLPEFNEEESDKGLDLASVLIKYFTDSE